MDEYAGFSYYYDLYYSDVTADHPFYLEIVRQVGADPHILELACGTGRLLLPLVEAGYRVTGLDLSDEMLARARNKLTALPVRTQARTRLLKGDMRYPRAVLGSEKFEMVILGFNTFQHMHEEEDQIACLENAREMLASQGIFVLAMDNSTPDEEPANKLIELYGVMHDSERQSSVTLKVITTDFPHHQIRTRRYMYYERLPGGNNDLVCNTTLKLRYFYADELKSLLEKAGFKIVESYGSYYFEEYATESPRIIYICQKAEPEQL
ncbi:class I SAM-dependent methyltransferase [Candidatus Chlorohelix sp.]|uniref:class I SAM-dependent methyltransferase n=1 Tax=Candidatus Chlorohelix sp. TaxID=3139201 RepID=UPI00302D0C9D